MANFLEASISDEVRTRLLSGQSIRSIGTSLQISKVTVQRYRNLLDLTAVKCACGKPVGHKGWCGPRISTSPSRQALVAKWALHAPAIIRKRSEPRLSLSYPFRTTDSRVEGADLVRIVNAAVPRYLPPALRADVAQEVILAVLSDELQIADLAKAMSSFVRAVQRQISDYGTLSLDVPMKDGRSWYDVLPDPTTL